MQYPAQEARQAPQVEKHPNPRGRDLSLLVHDSRRRGMQSEPTAVEIVLVNVFGHFCKVFRLKMGREETRKPTAILFPGLRWKLAENPLRNVFQSESGVGRQSARADEHE